MSITIPETSSGSIIVPVMVNYEENMFRKPWKISQIDSTMLLYVLNTRVLPLMRGSSQWCWITVPGHNSLKITYTGYQDMKIVENMFNHSHSALLGPVEPLGTSYIMAHIPVQDLYLW